MHIMYGKAVFSVIMENIRQCPEPRLVVYVKLENLIQSKARQRALRVLPEITRCQTARRTVCPACLENTLQLLALPWHLPAFHVQLGHIQPQEELQAACHV